MYSTIGVRRRKFTIFGKWFKVYLSLLLCIILIAVLLSSASEEDEINSKKNIIIKSEKEMEALLNDVEVKSWSGATSGSLQNQEEKENINYGNSIAGDLLLPNINGLNATELELKRAREAYHILINAASQTDGLIPAWLLMGIGALEKGAPKMTNGNFVVPWAEFDAGDTPYGGMIGGREVNYTNYTKEDRAAHGGGSDGEYYKGPFQLNKDLLSSADIYNYKIAAACAATHLMGDAKSIEGWLQDYSMPDDFKKGLYLACYNAGFGNLSGAPGHPAEIPDAAKNDFVALVKNVYSDKAKMQKIGEAVCKSGMAAINNMMWDFVNIPGVHLSESAVAKAKQYNPNFVPVESVYPDSTYYGRFKVNSGAPASISNSSSGSADAYAIGAEQLRYILGSYAAGQMAWNSMVTGLEQTGGTKDGSIGGGLDLKRGENITYYWQKILAGGKDTQQLIEESKGDIGEVGYKNNFPIFIQGTGLNDISNLKWAFDGKATTLGRSGCSMFALMSLIHGVGYGDMPLPKTLNNVDGLNDKGKICFEEMVKALPNGPVTSGDVMSLGYKVQTVPTTDEGLEELYGYLEEGIPFVVNVKFGDIFGYDENYRPHLVHFTNEGHFILLVGAYRESGKRYVEVVQSTYSNAGTRANDQNQLVFDFDELKRKKIIRSSGGSCVPAYTITGRIDSPTEPVYMNSHYTGVTRNSELESSIKTIVTEDCQTTASASSMIAKFKEAGYIALDEDYFVEVDKKNKTVDIFISDTDFLRITGINFYSDLKDTGTYTKGSYIGLLSESTKFERYVVREDNSIEKIQYK